MSSQEEGNKEEPNIQEEGNANGISEQVDSLRFDIRMVPSKIAYLTLNAAGGCLLFRNIFLLSIGLTVGQTGLISGICRITASVVGPLCGVLADCTGYRKPIFVILCFISASSTIVLLWVATELKPFPPNLVNNTLFYSMMLLSIIQEGTYLPVCGFLDSIVTNILSTKHSRESYGHQMMFASIGRGLTYLIVGIVSDHYYDPQMPKYSPAFFIYVPLILLMTCLVIVLVKQTNWESGGDEGDIVNTQTNSTSMKDILISIITTFDYCFIMFSVLITGILKTVYTNFLFIIMRDDMNASATSMGVAQMVNCFVDMCMFPVAKTVMQMVGGPKICIEIGVLAWVMRLLAVSYIQNPCLVVIPQTLHCLSYALLWTAVIAYTERVSSKEVYMTMFQIIYIMHSSIAGLIGNAAGGALYNDYNGPALYRGAAALGGLWLAVMFMYFHGVNFIKTKIKGGWERLE